MSLFGPSNPTTSPFLWGQGGQRLTPEELARERAMADQQAAIGMDFSPVGHWTQGAARLANAISGKVQGNRLDKLAEQNRAESQSVAAALLGADVQPDAVMGALMNPYVDPQVREIAQMQWQRMNPEPVDPTPIERLMLARGIERGSPEWNATLDAALKNETDPFINFSSPDFGYAGRQSGLMAALGGGDPVSGAPQTMEPPAEAIDALRRGEGSPQQFDEIFGAGAAARYMGASAPVQPQMIITPRELDALVNRFGPAEVQRRLDSGIVAVRGN